MAAVSGDPRVLGKESRAENPVLKQDSLDQLYRYQSKEKALSIHRLKQWTKYKDDYVALKSQLAVISDKLSYPAMAPFGPKAFFPGKLKHTNEILVLLGDNWFVERSAKQATEIVDRRIKKCNEMLEEIHRELERTESWLDHTKKALEEASDFEKHVEIIEESEEEGWRERHRQKVKEYRKKLAEMRSEKKGLEMKTDDDMWARLDELELQEELEEHLAKLGEDEAVESEENEEEEPIDLIKGPENTVGVEELPELSGETIQMSERKKVTWSAADSVRQFHNDEVLSRQQEDSPDTLRLTFRHSKEPKKRAKFSQLPEETTGSTGESASIVSSPSDIYQKFYGTASSDDAEPKSILKVKKSTTPIRHWELDAEKADRSHLKSRKQPDASDWLPSAVGDEVIERAPVPVVQETPEPEEQVNMHRPVSRFKVSRMNRRL